MKGGDLNKTINKSDLIVGPKLEGGGGVRGGSAKSPNPIFFKPSLRYSKSKSHWPQSLTSVITELSQWLHSQACLSIRKSIFTLKTLIWGKFRTSPIINWHSLRPKNGLYMRWKKLITKYINNQISHRSRFVFKTNGRIFSITLYKDHCFSFFYKLSTKNVEFH